MKRYDLPLILALLTLLLGVVIGRTSAQPASVTTSKLPVAPSPTGTAAPLPLATCDQQVARTNFIVCASTEPGALVALSVDYCAIHEASAPFDTFQQADATGQYIWDWQITPPVAPTCNHITFRLITVSSRMRSGDPASALEWTAQLPA